MRSIRLGFSIVAASVAATPALAQALSPDHQIAPRVSVSAPAFGADVQGDTEIRVNGEGFEKLRVTCWKGAGRFGKKTTVGVVEPNDEGDGSVVFPADEYPHGPLTITITGESDQRTDNYYLQVYNTGGRAWMAGAPEGAPPPAEGMELAFADDFEDANLSISRTGNGTTYGSHKIRWGDFSGIPFGDHENKENTPFRQRGTWLRIRADEQKNTTGLIASIGQDGDGVQARAPCYFECRFIAQSAPGAWPAFWLMTNEVTSPGKGVDELDVIEAYGGEGPGNPNSGGRYMIATHWWNQGPDGGADETQPGFYGPVDMRSLGGGAAWWETPHTYGVRVGKEETVYFCDNFEVARHPTARLSREQPLYFYVNFAIGGASGWRKDLSRYQGRADMYVDYVRVWKGE